MESQSSRYQNEIEGSHVKILNKVKLAVASNSSPSLLEKIPLNENQKRCKDLVGFIEDFLTTDCIPIMDIIHLNGC